MHRSRLARAVSMTAAAALFLAVAGPVAAAEPLTAVVAVDDTGTPAAGQAWVRVLHGSPDAPSVDVKANDADILTDVPFGTISDLPAGRRGHVQHQGLRCRHGHLRHRCRPHLRGRQALHRRRDRPRRTDQAAGHRGCRHPERRPGPGPRRPLLRGHARRRRPDPGRLGDDRRRARLPERYRLPRARRRVVRPEGLRRRGQHRLPARPGCTRPGGRHDLQRLRHRVARGPHGGPEPTLSRPMTAATPASPRPRPTRSLPRRPLRPPASRRSSLVAAFGAAFVGALRLATVRARR